MEKLYLQNYWKDDEWKLHLIWSNGVYQVMEDEEEIDKIFSAYEY